MNERRNRRAATLGLSWLAYASYYTGRKGFSVAKVAIASEFGLGTGALAAIDTGFLVAYAAGQLPSGMLTDRLGPRRIVAAGMLLSALCCALLSAACSAPTLAMLFALNGLAQATGWPGTTAAVAQCTDAAQRGRVMGVWSTCYQLGGVFATALAAWLLSQYGWRAVFAGPAAWLCVIGMIIAVFLRSGPGPTRADPASQGGVAGRPWRNPVLYSYGAAYFCLKLIRYSLLFWLPFYLHAAAGFDPVRSGYLSTSFELGGAVGSVGLGWLSDRAGGRRAPVALASLLGLAAALWCYARLGPADAWTHLLLLALIGALLFGPDALLSGAAAQDAGGPGAASAVGFVNAIGSAGALLQGALIASVQIHLGWQALFRVFFGLALLACLCLWPALRRTRPAV